MTDKNGDYLGCSDFDIGVADYTGEACVCNTDRCDGANPPAAAPVMAPVSAPVMMAVVIGLVLVNLDVKG